MFQRIKTDSPQTSTACFIVEIMTCGDGGREHININLR
jgi:hypothetical protein